MKRPRGNHRRVIALACGYCPTHRKMLYASRNNAKQAARLMHDPGIRAYPCQQVDGSWHIGHLPIRVRDGEATMRDLRGRR